MSEKATPKWKRFEALVGKVQSAFTPNAKVTLNDKIMGRQSGVERQLDISVRRTVGQFEMLIVIECKDHTKPVDVKDVEDFMGIVTDVGANKGALVSASGFTEAAKRRGTNAGIDMYRLVDAEAHEWRSYVAIPAVCDFRGLGRCQYAVYGCADALQYVSRQDARRIMIYDEAGNQIGTTLTLLWAKWNKREIPIEAGLYRDLPLSSKPIFVVPDGGRLARIDVVATVNVERKLFFGQVPLTQFTGFLDEATGKLVLPNPAVITTDYIDSREVEESWTPIPSVGSLAVKPILTLVALDHYPPTLPDDLK